MPLLGIFGIDNDGVNLAINLLILFLVVVYLALIAYTYLDARRRLDDNVLVGCATVAALFPFVGTIVYTILRPPEFLDDKRERALEIRASELRVRQLEESSCPNCEHPVERNFLRCPNCRARIKDPCESCGKPVDPRWTICPYCETPTRAAAASPQRRVSSRPPEEDDRPRKSSRPARAKRPVSRSSEEGGAKKRSGSSKQRTTKERSSKGRSTQDRTTKNRTTKNRSEAVVRRSQSSKTSSRSEPGDDGQTAPAS